MKKKQKYWVFSTVKSSKVKPTESEKQSITEYFQPMIEDFKKRFILKNPDKKYNYLIDIYSKWYQNFFYLCEKYKSEFPDRIYDESEAKFVRLRYTGKNLFEFSYFRHTGEWHSVADDLTLDDCKEMILSNPNFQPIF